jgi:hypothetical protein
MKYKIWELRFHFTEMRINTSKLRLVKSSFGRLRTLVDRAIFSNFSFFKGRVYTSLVSLIKVMTSRKSLSKYLMDTIDFNKHVIDIFINLAKIVRYGRHWDESCNEWRLLLIIYFDGNFPYAKLRPYDDYKNMSTLNTYCGIFSTCHNYKKIIIVDWILCPGQVRSKITQSKQKFYYLLIGL